MGGGQSVNSTRDYGEGQRRIPRKKPFCQGTKDMPGRWAGGGSPPSSTLPPLHKGGRPELMGAHHSRRDNSRVAWQEGSARKAWLPENFPVAGPGCHPPPLQGTAQSGCIHSANSCEWWDTRDVNVEAIPTAEPYPGSLPTLLKTHLWSDPALTSCTH